MKRVALISAASATATCLTVGAAPPPPPHHAVSDTAVALAASTGPDYTALITSLSNSTNNILFAQGNFQHALAELLGPLVSATGGSVNASTEQFNLSTVAGLLSALGAITVPDLSAVPGLPADAAAQLTNALLPGLGLAGLGLAPVLNLLGNLAVLNTVTGAVNGLNANPVVQAALALAGATGINVPGLDDLIPGLSISLTQYESDYDLPLLGLGTLLGLSGQMNVDNLFAQVPSLTVPGLVTGILGGLTVNTAAGPIALPPGVATAVSGVLTPLLSNLVATPSITAWVPLASGNYGLPLGGSYGFLATMPTLDVGSLTVLDQQVPGTDTVIAIPIFAGGVNLPLGLGSFGTLNTPGIVFPTATGINTIGGLSLTSLNLLGFGFTNVNAQLANYYGTNGIDYSNGQNVLLLTTPLGPVPIPIVYSLGSFNFGNDGFGFAGPSLFGVGLIPPFQVGDAPTQQSPDGLIPALALNTLHSALRAVVPTQVTSVTQLLGIPDVGAAVAPFLGQLYGATVTPLSTEYTNFLNQNIGSWTNGAASGFEQFTVAIANLSYGLPGATQPVVPPAGPQAAIAPAAQTLKVDPSSKVAGNNTPAITAVDQDPITNVQNQVRDANTQVKTSITAAKAKTKASVAKATADIEKSVKKTSATLNKIAKDGEAQVKKPVDGVSTAVKDTAKHVSDAAKGATEKKSETKSAAN